MVKKQKGHIKSTNNNDNMCFKCKIIPAQKVWKKLKEYQRLGPIEINMNGIKKNYQQSQKTGRNFK